MAALKLALGTVQFGMDYGINNPKGKVPEQEAFRILDAAISAGVDLLDTALAYGASEEVIGRYSRERSEGFRIVSKFSRAEARNADEALTRSLSRMGISSLYGYLLHRFEDYRDDPCVWDELRGLKASGKVSKIGFSLYRPEELEFLLKRKIDMDLLQVPYSIFDRRFEGYFPQLHEAGIEVHTRSVFLQGLVFRKPEQLQGYLSKIGQKLGRLHQMAKDGGVSVAGICLDLVLLNPWVDRVVVGVDGLDNFQQLVVLAGTSSGAARLSAELSALREDDEKIILPFLWGKT